MNLHTESQGGAAKHPALEHLLGAPGAPGEPGVDTERGWRQFQQRRRAAPEPKPARGWVAAAAGLALVGALGFVPRARTAAAEVLQLFRISQVTALPLNLGPGTPMNNPGTSALIRQMLQDELTVNDNQPNQPAGDAAAASTLAGFPVRAPRGGAWSGGQYLVRGGKDFSLTLSLDRLQQIVASAGLAGVQLPTALDGAVAQVHVPAAVAVSYGGCAPSSPDGGGAAGAGCTWLLESPSPTVQLPAGVDVNQLAVVGLQMLGMSADEAEEYCQTVDWTTTLVVPFPRQAAEAHEVPVDGVTGILLTHDQPGQGAHYMLLWSRGGRLYSVAGGGSGGQGLELAAALSQ